MRFFAIASVLFTAALGVFANPIVERGNPQSVACIFATLSETVTPLCGQLQHCNSGNATQEILTPIITEITTAVGVAVTDLGYLVGESLDVILLAVDGITILTVTEVANIVSVVICLVFAALQAVLAVVDEAIYSIIFDLCYTLGQGLCGLIGSLVGLIDGIAILLLILLLPVVSICGVLGLLGLLETILGGLL